jgi:endo-1,4-beta-D-glucanase Y
MMYLKKISIIVLFSSFVFSLYSQWLLPYPRPQKYDYSAYYDSVLVSRLSMKYIQPAEELKTAWKFYVETFIMSNGLVRHLRMSDDKKTVIGQNEAVSEGIGYGMLLAVICNDQANFNKIFEAGNQYMWGGSSYACWSWANGGCKQSGAATDADLDIGLALVFADKLQEYGYWTPYNKNGVTYKSRAEQTIAGIKTRMTSGDVLLPGDTWGGDGMNNINPSYFSTAAMRVFNDYQKTHDFTAVINKCYSILQGTRNYSKGQAPDWCNASGGQAAKYYGMSIEAIRVPWRIGLDALWFNDTKAIAYCKNTKGTITKQGTEEVFAQMIEYKADGSADMADPNRQADNFERIAMWSTAVLGSQDKSYTKGVFIKEISYDITGGTDEPYFGLLNSDANFYYKHSLGMLGYATIFGMFGNILDDLKNLPKPDTVKVTSGIKTSASSVKLPSTVTITATLEKAANWQVVITGQTSNKSDTIRDSSAQISIPFDGIGWFTVETVKVTLSGEKIAKSTTASMLSTTFSITGVPEKKTITAGSTITVHDMENGKSTTPWNGNWYIFADSQSTTTPQTASTLITSNAGNPGYGAKLGFTSKSFAGCGVTFRNMGTVDLTNFESVIFDIKTEGSVDSVIFSLGTTNNDSTGAYMQKSFAGSTSWTTQTILFSDLKAPKNSASKLNLKVSEKLQWQVSGSKSGTIYLDNIKIKLQSGKQPADDIYFMVSPVVQRFPLTRSNNNLFAIIQSNNGLIINAGNNLLPKLEIYRLNGERVLSYQFNMNTRYTDNQIVPIASGRLTPGQYVALLCDESGKSEMIARRFVWQ